MSVKTKKTQILVKTKYGQQSVIESEENSNFVVWESCKVAIKATTQTLEKKNPDMPRLEEEKQQ